MKRSMANQSKVLAKVLAKMLAVALTVGLWAGATNASTDSKDLLIKLTDAAALKNFALMTQSGGAKVETLGQSNWLRVQLTDKQKQTLNIEEIRSNPNVLAVQPNYKIRLLNDYRVQDPVLRAKLVAKVRRQIAANKNATIMAPADNPDIPTGGSGGTGADPLLDKQWGMLDINAQKNWSASRGQGIVVAVLDTGVDYTHEDLVDNLWRNPGESGKDAQGNDKSKNGIDDDGNGYVDDLIGWDVVRNDNKPYDLAVDPIEIMFKGGNPGHGTHCAGNVAARANNGKGVIGVAPEAKIMALRFLSEKGEGDTAGAIKAIQYAVKNGAKVLSNSWGSEGEDSEDAAGNQALRDAITEAQNAGTLFVAAAGNGHNGIGYDNDTDAKPAYPASYDHETIISVAALDSSDQLGSFSNWGAKTVDIGAPGVKVFSTIVGGKYSDAVIDLFGMKVTWDGTSMATPHVAGAAALWWAKHPKATWQEVKNAVMSSAKPISSMSGKSVTGGKLNMDSLMSR